MALNPSRVDPPQRQIPRSLGFHRTKSQGSVGSKRMATHWKHLGYHWKNRQSAGENVRSKYLVLFVLRIWWTSLPYPSLLLFLFLPERHTQGQQDPRMLSPHRSWSWVFHLPVSSRIPGIRTEDELPWVASRR